MKHNNAIELKLVIEGISSELRDYINRLFDEEYEVIQKINDEKTRRDKSWANKKFQKDFNINFLVPRRTLMDERYLKKIEEKKM